MNDREEQAETFNQDQQEMFQNADTKLGETRPHIPGAQNIPPLAPPSSAGSGDAAATDTPVPILDGTEIT